MGDIAADKVKTGDLVGSKFVPSILGEMLHSPGSAHLGNICFTSAACGIVTLWLWARARSAGYRSAARETRAARTTYLAAIYSTYRRTIRTNNRARL
jgi:hypothetical protein